MIEKNFRFHWSDDLNAAACSRAAEIFGWGWRDVCNHIPAWEEWVGMQCGEDQIFWSNKDTFEIEHIVGGGNSDDTRILAPITTTKYYPNGQVRGISYSNDGRFSDRGDSPAIVHFWENGNLQKIEHRWRGEHINPESGEPTMIYWDRDGTIAGGTIVSGNKLCSIEPVVVLGMLKNAGIGRLAKIIPIDIVIAGKSQIAGGRCANVQDVAFAHGINNRIIM